MQVDHDEFLPTVNFGFQLTEGKHVLHQMWVTPMGLTEWRPVPMIELSERKPATVGFLPQDDD